MPAYNVEIYIEQAIKSILSQTYSDFELLILNDGSTDGTESVIKKFDDPRIRYFSFKKNRGNVEAINYLFEEALGQYIAFQDADDWCTESRIEEQILYLLKNPLFVACGTQYYHVEFSGKIVEAEFVPNSHSEILEKIEVDHYPSVCCGSLLFRGSLLKSVGKYRIFFSGIGSADFDWYFRVLKVGEVANLNNYHYYYRQHYYSVTKSITSNPLKNVSYKIAYILYKDEVSGKEMLDCTGVPKLDLFIEEYLEPYNNDSSLIFREMAYFNCKKGFYKICLHNIGTAIYKNFFEIKNYRALKFIFWKYKNR